MMSFFDPSGGKERHRQLQLLAWTAAICVPLLVGTLLWAYHIDTIEWKGADFAYPQRITFWSWVSYCTQQGAPFLSGYAEAKGSFLPVEEVFTDDMGFSVLVNWMTCITGRALGRNDFFNIVLALNVILLWLFLGSFKQRPLAMLLASLLLISPPFWISKKVIGPDLFCLYGTLSLTCVTVAILVIHGQSRWTWIGTGILAGGIYFLRQALGMIIIFTLLLHLLFWLRNPAHRSRQQWQRWFCVAAGFLIVWAGFHAALRWRDYQIGLKPGESHASKHHTIFHPLYVGIGNIKNNPWGIVYDDKFAFDMVLGEQTTEKRWVQSTWYLDEIRERYLSLWKNDGWRLFQCYLSHFFFVVKTTLGYVPFLLGFGYAIFISVFSSPSSHPQSILETCIMAFAAALLAFLIQSTLVDYQLLFSYPTALLGRFLVAFAAADALRRFLHRQRPAGAP